MYLELFKIKKIVFCSLHTDKDIAYHLHTIPDGHTKSTPLITIPTPSDTKVVTKNVYCLKNDSYFIVL